MKIIIEGEVKEIAALLHGGAVERLGVKKVRERMGAYSSSGFLFNPELVEDLANKLGKTLSSKIEQANIEARTASDKIN